MAGIENHLVGRMPLLAALHQNVGLLLGRLIDRGLDIENVGHYRVVGVQVGNFAEVYWTLSTQQDRFKSPGFGRERPLGGKPEHEGRDEDCSPETRCQLPYAHESFAAPSLFIVRLQRPFREPIFWGRCPPTALQVTGLKGITIRREMAGTTGLEPATSDVTGRRSNQLNYVPALGLSNITTRPMNRRIAPPGHFSRDFSPSATPDS